MKGVLPFSISNDISDVPLWLSLGFLIGVSPIIATAGEGIFAMSMSKAHEPRVVWIIRWSGQLHRLTSVTGVSEGLPALRSASDQC